jgi:hypothetical protein
VFHEYCVTEWQLFGNTTYPTYKDPLLYLLDFIENDLILLRMTDFIENDLILLRMT